MHVREESFHISPFYIPRYEQKPFFVLLWSRRPDKRRRKILNESIKPSSTLAYSLARCFNQFNINGFDTHEKHKIPGWEARIFRSFALSPSTNHHPIAGAKFFSHFLSQHVTCERYKCTHMWNGRALIMKESE